MSGFVLPGVGSGFFRALSFSGGNNASVISNPDGAMEQSPSSGSITRNHSGNNLDNTAHEHKVKLLSPHYLLLSGKVKQTHLFEVCTHITSS